MNIFGELFKAIVYQPQLNLLYFLFQITGDIGLSFILLAIIVNVIIFPLFAKSYVNLQKTRILQPWIKELQTKHKADPQKMMAEMGKFNKKHGISNSSTFLVLFVQIFFFSGLYTVINDVVTRNQVDGLYQLFFNKTTYDFKAGTGQLLAFGKIDIGASASSFLWIPLISMFFSYLYGMYTFKWAPQPVLPTPKKVTKKKDSKTETPILDPEVMRKSMEFQSIYVLPIFLFFIQYTLPTGLNIYFLTSSALSIVRQYVLINFYSSHTDKLLESIAESDPFSKDDNPANNLEITADPEQMVMEPVATAIVPAKKYPEFKNLIDSKKGKPLSAKEKSIAKKKKK